MLLIKWVVFNIMVNVLVYCCRIEPFRGNLFKPFNINFEGQTTRVYQIKSLIQSLKGFPTKLQYIYDGTRLLNDNELIYNGKILSCWLQLYVDMIRIKGFHWHAGEDKLLLREPDYSLEPYNTIHVPKDYSFDKISQDIQKKIQDDRKKLGKPKHKANVWIFYESNENELIQLQGKQKVRDIESSNHGIFFVIDFYGNIDIHQKLQEYCDSRTINFRRTVFRLPRFWNIDD